MQSFCLVIDPLQNIRIGVATTYGRPYYKFSTYLKILNLQFDSILPRDIPRYCGHLILSTIQEVPKECMLPILYEDTFEQHPTVVPGLMIQKLNLGYGEEELLVGVDPGKRMGLSIFYCGREIENSVYTSVDELVFHITRILGGLRAKYKIVKVGNGNMTVAREIATLLNLRFCSSFDLEFVDEQKTSMKIKNFNQRGKRDMLSAKYITQRDGYRQLILPLSMIG